MAFTFGTRQHYPVGVRAFDVLVVDLNRDGLADLAAPHDSSPGTVSGLLGLGDGTFEPTLSSGSGGSGAFKFASADLNADGRADLVTANLYSNSVSILLGRGDGTFAVSGILGADAPRAVAMADFDGDGVADLAIATANGVQVLRNDGAAAFTLRQIYSGIPTANLLARDIDGDGFADLLVTKPDGIDVSVLYGNGDLSFAPALRVRIDGSIGGSGPLSAAVGDVNGDGIADIVTANQLGTQDGRFTVSVVLGNGDRSFQPAREAVTGARPVDVVLGDMDADGRQDILTANDLASEVSYLAGNGDGTFQSHRDFETGGSSAVAVADLNGDGRLDAVTAGAGGAITVLPGAIATNPFVLSAEYGPNDGGLRAGESVQVRLTLSEAVTVANGSGLNLHMSAGGFATYEAALSDATHLVYDYVVPFGQGEADLRIVAYEFNGAVIRDVDGEDLDLSGAVTNPDGILRVVTRPPVVRDVVFLGADSDLRAGDAVDIRVRFIDPLLLRDAENIVLHMSDGGEAGFLSSASANEMIFRHTVQAGAQSDDLRISAYEVNGAVLVDEVGNEFDYSSLLAAPQGRVRVDGVAPTVTDVSFAPSETNPTPGTLTTISLALSEAVSVSGGSGLRINLNDGSVASYDEGRSDQTHLVYAYVVPATSRVADLDIVSYEYNRAVVLDAFGNEADLGAAITLSRDMLM